MSHVTTQKMKQLITKHQWKKDNEHTKMYIKIPCICEKKSYST